MTSHRMRRKQEKDLQSNTLPTQLEDLHNQPDIGTFPKASQPPSLDPIYSTSDGDSSYARRYEDKYPSSAQNVLAYSSPGQMDDPADKTLESLLTYREKFQVKLPADPMEPVAQSTMMSSPGSSAATSTADQTVIFKGEISDARPKKSKSVLFVSPEAYDPETISPILQSSKATLPKIPGIQNAALDLAVSGVASKMRTRTKGTPVSKVCDLLLPTGEFLSELEVVKTYVKSPLWHPMLRLKTTHEQREVYRTDYLWVDNVTGCLLKGMRECFRWSELQPTGQYGTFKPLSSIPTDDLANHPSVRAMGDAADVYPRWSFGPVSYYGVNKLVNLSRQNNFPTTPKEIPTRFGSAKFLLEYDMRRTPGLGTEGTVYVDPWFGDLYSDPGRASSLLRDKYLCYEGGPLPMRSPKRFRYGTSMTAEPPPYTSKKRWYIPGTLDVQIESRPTYDSDLPSPRGNKVIMFVPPPGLTYEVGEYARLHYDMVTGEILVSEEDDPDSLQFTGYTLSPRPFGEKPSTPTNTETPKPAKPEELTNPRRSVGNPALRHRIRMKQAYQRWKIQSQRITEYGVWAIHRKQKVQHKHLLQRALDALSDIVLLRMNVLEKMFPESVQQVDDADIVLDTIPSGMPEGLLELVTEVKEGRVSFQELESPAAYVEGKVVLPNSETSSVHSEEAAKGITTKGKKILQQYLAWADMMQTYAAESYLQEFPKPSTWQDPPPHPTRPIYKVEYEEGKITGKFKQDDPTQVPGGLLAFKDNLVDLRTKDVDNPRYVYFNADGTVAMADGKPEWPICIYCCSVLHLAEDCYVTKIIKDRGLDLDHNQRPKACKLCKSYQHSTYRCQLWDFYKDCVLCSEDHDTMECPTRLSTDKMEQKALTDPSNYPGCGQCKCKENGFYPCYHHPPSEPLDPGYHYKGVPCKDCTGTCICTVEVVKSTYCQYCGRELPQEYQSHILRCHKLSQNKDACSFCGGCDHHDTECRYAIYQKYNYPLPCGICDGNHTPLQCPDIKITGREVFRESRQCTLCLMQNHDIATCPWNMSAPRPPRNRPYCPNCGSLGHISVTCPINTVLGEEVETKKRTPKKDLPAERKRLLEFQRRSMDRNEKDVITGIDSITQKPWIDERPPHIDWEDQGFRTPINPQSYPTKPSQVAVTRAREHRTQGGPRGRSPGRSSQGTPPPQPHRKSTHHGDPHNTPPNRPPPIDPRRPPRKGGNGRKNPGGGGGGNGDGGDGGDGDDEEDEDLEEDSYDSDEEWSTDASERPPRPRRRRRRRRGQSQAVNLLSKVVENQNKMFETILEKTMQQNPNTTITEKHGDFMATQLGILANQASYEHVNQITVFDGKNKEKFDDWLLDVETLCARYKLNPLRTAFARSSGNLRLYISEIDATQKWERIRGDLISEFSPNPTVYHVTHKLANMQQGSEGTATYCKAYARLVSQVCYKNAKDITYEPEIYRFIASLRNVKLAEKVQDKEPKSLAEAMQWAQKLERPMRKKEALVQFRPGNISGRNGKRDKQILEVRKTSAHMTHAESSQGNPDLIPLPGGQDYGTRVEIMAVSQGKNSEDNKCWRCNGIGHWSWDCQKKKPNSTGGTYPVQGRLSYTASGSIPLTEGMYDFVATAIQKANRYKKDRDQLRAQMKESQEHVPNPVHVRPPPKEAQKASEAKNRSPAPRKQKDKDPPPKGGAKKFNFKKPDAPKKTEKPKEVSKEVNAVGVESQSASEASGLSDTNSEEEEDDEKTTTEDDQ